METFSNLQATTFPRGCQTSALSEKSNFGRFSFNRHSKVSHKMTQLLHLAGLRLSCVRLTESLTGDRLTSASERQSRNKMRKTSIVPEPAKCAGCMICMLRCSLRLEGMFRLTASRIKVNRLVNAPGEFEIVLTDDCDACGICVRYCPYGALSQEKAGKGK